MKTLILGHTYNYKKTDIRCSPIDVDLWYDKPFDCVDCGCDKEETTFKYDIYRSIDYNFEKKLDIKNHGFGNLWKIIHMILLLIVLDLVFGTEHDKNTEQAVLWKKQYCVY